MSLSNPVPAGPAAAGRGGGGRGAKSPPPPSHALRGGRGGEWMPGQADGLAGTSQGAPRPAFRPSPAAGTPPRRNCVPGNRVPPRAVQEATRRLSPRPGRRRVRNGFPSLLGDRAARRRDVRARWRHGPREAPGSGRKREARVGVRAKGSSDAECARGRAAGRVGGCGERAQPCLLGWEPPCVHLASWSSAPVGDAAVPALGRKGERCP